jgi:hypothetical protein
MKQVHDPNNLANLKYINNGEFHIGQCYDTHPAEMIYCNSCGGSDFKVGQGSCFTAIKCKKCEYEVCIHDG